MPEAKHTYLEFSVKALTILSMWPQSGGRVWSFVKQYYITFILTITLVPVAADLTTQFYEETFHFTDIIENIIAFTALFGVIYIAFCFIKNKEQIKSLIEDLSVFEEFTPMSLILETESSAKFYTKLFIVYGFLGNFCYGLMPLLNYHQCQKHRTFHMQKYGIPCGMITRYVLPFRYDTSPLKQMLIITVIVECTLATTIIMSVTMLLCGVLIHITSHLKYLKTRILDLSALQGPDLDHQMKFCVRFHTALIDYATRSDSCFNKMMLLHVSWTSFVISVLGFEIIMTDNFTESIRFGMHLAGWLGMLFIVCYYGQTLMDESFGISEAAYSFAWYDKPVALQKYVVLILMRSQKPLTMSAVGLKIMSLSTFIGILYSAYSYFTLLLKFKP